MKEGNKLLRIEIAAVILGALILWLALTLVNGREAHTDVLWYMNMSQNNIPDPHWLTRYTHVFLQMPFLTAAANPFEGIVWFWAFLVASSAGLIYILHRLLFPNSNFIHAGLSVGMFLAFDLHGINAGVPLADLTAAFVILVILLAFWLIARQDTPSKMGLIILGILFIVAFKTKETIWIVGVLVFGVSGGGLGNSGIKSWLLRIKWVIVGLLIGILGFVLLNALFLKDFLFDFRPSHLETYLNFWISDAGYYPGSANWLVDGIMISLPFVFLLFLLAGNKLSDSSGKQKLIWALPFATILFLTVGMVKNTYIVYPRFLFPSQAIMSIFVPSLIPFVLPKKSRERWLWFGKLGVGLVVYAVLYEGLKMLISTTGIVFSDFVSSIFIPVVVIGLLLIIIMKPKQTWLNTLIPLVLLVAFLRPGLLDNLRKFQLQPPEYGFQTRFYPLIVYGDSITPTEDDHYLVSISIPEHNFGFSDDLDTLRTIFDLHYGIRTQRQQFTFVDMRNGLDLLSELSGPVYLFAEPNEIESAQTEDILPNHCSVIQNEAYEVLLIKCAE